MVSKFLDTPQHSFQLNIFCNETLYFAAIAVWQVFFEGRRRRELNERIAKVYLFIFLSFPQVKNKLNKNETLKWKTFALHLGFHENKDKESHGPEALSSIFSIWNTVIMKIFAIQQINGKCGTVNPPNCLIQSLSHFSLC